MLCNKTHWINYIAQFGIFYLPIPKRFLSVSAYETLSDANSRKEYDTIGHSAFTNGKGQRGNGSPFEQSFNFNFDDLFKDFNFFGQNQNTRP